MLTTRHVLLTGSWTAEVETMETAVGAFASARWLANPCHVVFFEVVGDGDLHVSVWHERATKAVRGWAGPVNVSGGFVNSRRFGATQPREILRHIHDMVFAAAPVK